MKIWLKTKNTQYGIRISRNSYYCTNSAIAFRRKEIPELMKGLGKGVKSFKDGMKEGDEEMNSREESSK